MAALRDFLETQRGRDADYDVWLDALSFEPAQEAHARTMVERLALAGQAAVLLSWNSPAAEAFCRLRLRPRGAAYGAFDATIDAETILDRAMPA